MLWLRLRASHAVGKRVCCPRVGETTAAGQRTRGRLAGCPLGPAPGSGTLTTAGGTGPVAVPGGPKLSPGNAVDVLLSDIYRHQPDPELQNSFFALYRPSLSRLSEGSLDPFLDLGRKLRIKVD